ncbi:MAG: protein kinase [Pseudomonadota bacterium]
MTDEFDVFGEPPQALLLAIEQLISGERTISEFRDEMLNIMYESPGSVSAVRSLVDDYARRGLIPEQIHRLLQRDIDKTTTEDLVTAPTEFTFTSETATGVSESTSSVENIADTGEHEQPEAAPPKQSIAVGSLLRDRFEIVGKAAGGSMGVVFKAIDRRMAEAEGGQPYVAIKVLAPEYAGHAGAMRALQQEATKGRYLLHPNIVRFLDMDRTGDDTFLVMEWLEGRPLSAILNEKPGRPIAAATSWQIIREVGNALAYAHELGVTHADIKPGNIMILPDGSVKLLDFGIARVRGDFAGKSLGTDPRILNAATPAYASPQVLGGKPAKPEDDVFSLACVAYRLLSGFRVFRDKSALDAQSAGRLPDRIESISGRQWHALAAALTFETDRRTPSISEFLRQLRIADESGGTGWKPYAVVASCAVALATLLMVAMNLPRNTSVSTKSETKNIQTANARSVTERIAPIADAHVEYTPSNRVSAVAAPGSRLSLMLPSADSVVPALDASLVLYEGDASAQITLSRQDVGVVRQLQLQRLRNDGLFSVVKGALPLPDRLGLTLAGEQSEIGFLVDVDDDAWIAPDLIERYNLLDISSGELLARLTLTVKDDEYASLAPTVAADTVSFATSEISVTERDTVIRIPVWRLNPSAAALTVPLQILDATAVADEDFVVSGDTSLSFPAGIDRQLVLLPLVADDLPEGDEQFLLQLPTKTALEGVYTTLTVRILDGQGEAPEVPQQNQN